MLIVTEENYAMLKVSRGYQNICLTIECYEMRHIKKENQGEYNKQIERNA